MALLKKLPLAADIQAAMLETGTCVIRLQGSEVFVYDIFPEYGEPHYPLGRFLTTEKLQALGIDESRANHIERQIRFGLFASREAFLKCSIANFVHRWTQRDLHSNGITSVECQKITDLFSAYGYVLEASVSPATSLDNRV